MSGFFEMGARALYEVKTKAALAAQSVSQVGGKKETRKKRMK